MFNIEAFLDILLELSKRSDTATENDDQQHSLPSQVSEDEQTLNYEM